MINNKRIDHHPMKDQLLVFLTLPVQLSGVTLVLPLLPEPVLTRGSEQKSHFTSGSQTSTESFLLARSNHNTGILHFLC